MIGMILTVAFHLTLAASLPQAVGYADIRDAASAFDIAQARGDRHKLDQLMGSDFHIIMGSGAVLDKQAFIDDTASPGLMMEPFVIGEEQFLLIAPETVIVTGKALMRGTINGNSFSSSFRYADTFVRRHGYWQVVFCQVTNLPD